MLPRAERRTRPLPGLAPTLILALAVFPSTPTAAQSAAARLAPGPSSVPDVPAPTGPGSQQDRAPGELEATLASAVLPGAGQLLQGRRRGVLFTAAELVAWGLHLDARSDGRRFRRAYRDLAWSVARGAPEPRVDGDFEYYERLAHWVRSGAFDADPLMPDVQPETDPAAYNGRQWRLAADIWLGGDVTAGPGTEGYEEALELYDARAYREPFTWDWGAAPGRQARFAGLIEESDGRFQAASLALAAVVANHVLAALDAFVAARSGDPDRPSLRLSPGPGPGGTGLVVHARIPLPGGPR